MWKGYADRAGARALRLGLTGPADLAAPLDGHVQPLSHLDEWLVPEQLAQDESLFASEGEPVHDGPGSNRSG